MILVDTSIWVDYIRVGDPTLTALLNEGRVLVHPAVIGELVLGNLRDRASVMHDLRKLSFTARASDAEVLAFIELHRLHGLGIGYVDCHLLAAVRLTPGSTIWTRDKRLSRVATQMGLAATIRNDINGARLKIQAPRTC